MTETNTNHLSWDEWDELHNPPPVVTDFDRVVERAISRRGFLSVLAMGSAAVAMGSVGNLMSSTSAQAQEAASRFPFKPIAAHTDATVHVPEGYSWKPLAKWGQPLFSTASDIDPMKGVSLENSDKVFGENTDGMEAFAIGNHQVIAVNHEYVNNETNLPHAPEGMPQSMDDVKILQNMQGVKIGEVTSGLLGPTANVPVAMGYVDLASAGLGTVVNAMVRGKAVPMTVSAMPFVPNRYYRG